MDDLYFDAVKVDTSLAEEYIKKKNIYVEEPKQGRAWNYGAKKFFDLPSSLYVRPSVTNVKQKLRNLSEKLQENSELFCQMEYLMRKKDVDETRNCHLKILSQYLRLEEWNFNILYSVMSFLTVKESTPLYCLGHVATVARSKYMPVLLCVKSTALVCYLFYELCLEVGLEISLYLINRDCNDYRTATLSMGCTLAITEDADIDSAVDVFINSSEQAPWRIERIYVQESVYAQLMEALEMRCTRVASERCVDAFRTCRGRGVECGTGAGAGGGVPVRAYRGARELLALLPPEGGSLSLWCGTAAAANELALASPSDLVWIDHYAVFDGPPSASMPLYYDTLAPEVSSFNIPENVFTRLLELQRAWIALSIDKRKAIVLEVLEKASDNPTSTKLAEDIANWIPSDLVDIGQGRITMVIDRPLISSKTVFIYNNDDDQMLQLLKSTILGNMISIYEESTMFFNYLPLPLVSNLFDAGVPLTKSEITFSVGPKSHEIKTKYLHRKIKVIHSRYGTIYAN